MFIKGAACFLYFLLLADGRLIPAGRGRLDQRDHPRGRHGPRLHPPARLPRVRPPPRVGVRVSRSGQEQVRLERRQQTLHIFHQHQRYGGAFLMKQQIHLIGSPFNCNDTAQLNDKTIQYFLA